MSKTFRPYELNQRLLLPPDLREWLPEDHLAFFVSDGVDALDLKVGHVAREGTKVKAHASKHKAMS